MPRAARAAATGCVGAFHCAGKGVAQARRCRGALSLHVEGTRTVLDACAAAGVRRVVVASTSGTVAVSENADHIATENDPAPIGLLGRWPYYRSKLFVERAALDRSGPALEIVSVNPSLLLGPRRARILHARTLRSPSSKERCPRCRREVSRSSTYATPPKRCAASGSEGAGRARYLIGACNMTVREFFGPPRSGVRGARPVGADAAFQRARLRGGCLGRARGDARGFPYGHRSRPRLRWPNALVSRLDEGGDGARVGPAAHKNETLHDTVEDLRARGVVWNTGS